jgi:hypothetical protein
MLTRQINKQNHMTQTQSQSGIEQINLGFNEQEDRLLLKLGLIDKTEIAVWVSRRICKAMWALLQSTQITMPPAVTITNTTPAMTADSKSQVMETFAREVAEQKAMENMDFNSTYRPDRQTLTDEPMLAIQCIVISAENQLPNLELQCKNGQSVKMALSNELVHALTNMMQLATREAGWDLLMSGDKPQLGILSNQQLLH